MIPPSIKIKTTCPRDCYDACGIVVITKDGNITKVLGDPEHERSRGALCGKCALAYNGVWLSKEDRLLEPLKRVGPKGSGCFVPVSWDEALSDIASRLHKVIQKGDGSSILHTHYTGTCSLIAGNMPIRFFNYLGATEVDPDTVCNKAGHEALKIMFGNSFKGFDPKTSDETQCLLIWGANPSAAAPHIHKHWLTQVKKHAKLIVIDPIAHDTARSAHIHLQPRPGTDAVLAFGIVHILEAEGMLDHDFINSSVQGWEKIYGDIKKCNPSYVEAVTGVRAELLAEAAKIYGRGLSMMWIGQGLQRQPQAGNIMRSVSLLPACTGNIGKPGTGFYFMNAFPDRGVDMEYLCGTHLRQDSQQSVSHMDLVQVLEDQNKCQILFTWNNNIAASNPRQADLNNALLSETIFHVAVDIFHTDTTKFADYVLPAASFLEFDDLVISYFDYTVSVQAKACDPMGNSLPNQEIFRRLARKMKLEAGELFETDQQILEKLISQLSIPETFSTLMQKGTVPWRSGPVVHFKDGEFPTPSGKIQVASTDWLTAGLSEVPLAKADPLPKPSWYRLLSPADTWLMNSSYGNDSRILDRLGAQKAWIHPSEMTRDGFVEGQPVKLKNATGELEVNIHASDRVMPGVVLVPKGRWLKNEASGANVNVLNPGIKSDLAESSSVHGIEVKIETVNQELS